MITIYAPASIGNVGVGFDVLGAAIQPITGSLLGDCVSVQAAEQFSLHNQGQFVSALPDDPQENIVYQCWQRFCRQLGKEIPVRMILEKNMPVGSGLGSSACSVVASLLALNKYCQHPLDDTELLVLMGEMEGRFSGSIHYDNVAPCFQGGLQLLLAEEGIISQPVPVFESWLWVMAYPGIHVSTAEARRILPAAYPRETCIHYGRLLAGFVHACHSGQSALAAALIQDVLAEPYRTCLLPRFAESRQAVQSLGALACGISGSGPTLFAVCENLHSAEKVADWLHQHYLQAETGFVHICRLDMTGARQLG